MIKMGIYFITVMEKMPKGLQHEGSRRLLGYFKDYGYAKELIKKNNGDAHETIYDYAVIEEYEEGMYSMGKVKQWYKFNVSTGKYEELSKEEEPETLFSGYAY